MVSDFYKQDSGSRDKNPKVAHRARVINNLDPLQMGRIQVTIQSVMEETNQDTCPWVLNGVNNAGTSPANKIFSVPEVGTEVEVYAKEGKEDILYYRGAADNNLTRTPSLFDKNYPMTQGSVNSIGDVFRIDKKDGELEFYRHLFSQLFKMDKDGNIYLHLDGNLIVNAKNVYFKTAEDFGLDAGQRIGMSAGNNFEIEGNSGDCSINANSGVLGLNGGPKVASNSGIKAGVIGSVLGAIGEEIGKVRSALSSIAAQVASVLIKDGTNRNRIGKE